MAKRKSKHCSNELRALAVEQVLRTGASAASVTRDPKFRGKVSEWALRRMLRGNAAIARPTGGAAVEGGGAESEGVASDQTSCRASDHAGGSAQELLSHEPALPRIVIVALAHDGVLNDCWNQWLAEAGPAVKFVTAIDNARICSSAVEIREAINVPNIVQTAWGTVSIVDAMVQALGYALSVVDGTNDSECHFIFISGRCVPTMHPKELISWAFEDGNSWTLGGQRALHEGFSNLDLVPKNSDNLSDRIQASDVHYAAHEHHACVILCRHHGEEFLRVWPLYRPVVQSVDAQLCHQQQERDDSRVAAASNGKQTIEQKDALVLGRDIARPDEYTVALVLNFVAKHQAISGTRLVEFLKTLDSDRGGHPATWTCGSGSSMPPQQMAFWQLEEPKAQSLQDLICLARRGCVPFVRKVEGLKWELWCALVGAVSLGAVEPMR